MKATEIVGAHDPDKVHAGAAPDQISDDGKRIGNAEIGFETGNVDASVAVSARGGGARSASGARPRVSLSGLPGVTATRPDQARSAASPIGKRRDARRAADRRCRQTIQCACRVHTGGKTGRPRRSNRVATGRRGTNSSFMTSKRGPSRASPPAAGDQLRPRLSVAAYAVFETGQLFDTDRSTGVEPPGGNADLGAEAELAAVGELGRRIINTMAESTSRKNFSAALRSSLTIASV